MKMGTSSFSDDLSIATYSLKPEVQSKSTKMMLSTIILLFFQNSWLYIKIYNPINRIKSISTC